MWQDVIMGAGRLESLLLAVIQFLAQFNALLRSYDFFDLRFVALIRLFRRIFSHVVTGSR